MTVPSSRQSPLSRPIGLRSKQGMIIALLFGGYAALYFCRADLSVGAPLIIDDLSKRGLSHADAIVRMGTITSLGVLAYALGKLFLGGLGDFWGGRVSFLIGLGGATGFTLLFAAGGAVPVFTIAWLGNRLTQSIAWAGLIKVSSKWFDYSSHGLIIGILSISYLVGDAAARQWMGMLIERGYGWRAMFYFAAAVAGACFIANSLFLRESRTGAGYDEAEPNPLNLFAASASRPASFGALLLPLLRSRSFVLVCLLSLGCTIIRETFNIWTPVYLRDYLGYTVSNAAGMSAIFPGVGAVSVRDHRLAQRSAGPEWTRAAAVPRACRHRCGALGADGHAFEHLGRAAAADRRSEPLRFACSAPIPISAVHSRWTSGASKRPPPRRASSTESVTWAPFSPATASHGSRWRSDGRACSSRLRVSARRRRWALRCCMS